MQRLRYLLFFVLLSSSLLCSCQAGFSVKSTPYTKGSILVLPPRDAVPESASEKNLAAATGTGKTLSDLLLREFNSRNWEVSVAAVADGLGHGERIAADQALGLGRDGNVRYVLTAVMGDLRDAAPFTIVDDFVVLDEARMYDCVSGEVVWELSEPFRAGDNAFGAPSGAVWAISVLIARSIEEEAD